MLFVIIDVIPLWNSLSSNVVQLLFYSKNEFAVCQLGNCSAYMYTVEPPKRATLGPERLALVVRLAFVGIVCYSIIIV